MNRMGTMMPGPMMGGGMPGQAPDFNKLIMTERGNMSPIEYILFMCVKIRVGKSFFF